MDKLLTNPNGKLLGNENGKVYTTPAITDRTYKQKYQEVLWLGSDMVPELPTQMPNQQGIDGYIDALAKIWTDIDDDNYSIINFGYNRVVLLAQYSGKLVKVEIVQESSGLFGSRVHSSVYKENVKECISLNTNKRYKLINDTYETPQEPSYFLEETSGYSKPEIDAKLLNFYRFLMQTLDIDFSQTGGNHKIEFNDNINTHLGMYIEINGNGYDVYIDYNTGGLVVYDENNDEILNPSSFFYDYHLGGKGYDNYFKIESDYVNDESNIYIEYMSGVSTLYEN